MSEKRYKIIDAAHAVGRVQHTLRVWEKTEKLPEHLRAKRDERGWRYWTQDQIDGINKWIDDEDIRPGSYFRKKKKEKKNDN